MTERLDDQAIAAGLATLPGWRRVGGALSKEFEFASFPDALGFVLRLGFEAERADHHPDILITYRRVTLSYSTHSAGGITAKDLDGATGAERSAR